MLATVGRAPGPVTAAWVREQTDPALAHTTVVTTLTRLEAKHAVVRRHSGRDTLWSAVDDAAGLVARRMHQLLEGERDREAVLIRFVAQLSPAEEQVLRARLGGDTGTLR